MRNETISRDSLTWLSGAHRDVMNRIAELRRWWSELDELGVPRFGEMGARLEELRDQLAEHFAQEERGGYLKSALAVAPRFARPAEKLREQHGQLLENLNKLINQLRACQPEFECWRDARDEFEVIVADLSEHECAENSIVQAAFGDDIGTAD